MTNDKREELLKLVERLRGEDHIFLSKAGVKLYSQPFGFIAQSYLYKANPEDPKGLTLANGAKEAWGRDAAALAIDICDHLGVPYARSFGRGHQLRICCDALEKYLSSSEWEQRVRT